MRRGDRTGPDFAFERQGPWPVCGIDEAGRGPWAGPVVAAAVLLDPAAIPRGLDDSKRLQADARDRLFGEIAARARTGVGIVEAADIDRVNILQATFEAMRRALAALGPVELALVDGNRSPPLTCSVRTVIGGDGLSLSIAAASIVAKVTRDRLMARLDAEYPGYGFARHKGYGTALHAAALARLGPCPQHRMSFAPVRAAAARLNAP